MLKQYHLLCNEKNIAIKHNMLRYHSNSIAIRSKKLSLNANIIVLKSQKSKFPLSWPQPISVLNRCNQLIYDFGKPHFISHIDVNMGLDFVAFLNWQLTLVLIINNCQTSNRDIMIWTYILSWILNKVLNQPLHIKWIDRSIAI